MKAVCILRTAACSKRAYPAGHPPVQMDESSQDTRDRPATTRAAPPRRSSEPLPVSGTPGAFEPVRSVYLRLLTRYGSTATSREVRTSPQQRTAAGLWDARCLRAGAQCLPAAPHPVWEHGNFTRGADLAARGSGSVTLRPTLKHAQRYRVVVRALLLGIGVLMPHGACLAR